MLFPKELWGPIARGEVTHAFRRWKRPTVRVDGTLRSAAGRLAITAMDRIDPDEVTDAEARLAGAADREEVVASLQARDVGECWRIVFHVLDEPDPRAVLAATDDLDDEVVREVVGRLDRLDARAADGPWTRATLRVIAEHPHVAAGELAATLGRERDPFKLDVRKLKAMGLTTSHRVGYSLSPRGRAILAVVVSDQDA